MTKKICYYGSLVLLSMATFLACIAVAAPAKARPKAKARPRYSQATAGCSASATINSITVGQSAVTSQITLRCSAGTGFGCSYEIVQSLWGLVPNAGEYGSVSQDMGLGCGSAFPQTARVSLYGVPPGTYRYIVGVYSGTSLIAVDSSDFVVTPRRYQALIEGGWDETGRVFIR